MGEVLLSLTAIAVAAIGGSHLFRYLAERFGQNIAFGIMASLLVLAFAVQTWLERSPG